MMDMFNQVIYGDSLEKLKTMNDNFVDSIVTDPPYELGFMGKGWDKTGIAYNVEMWRECLRVLKPGGHLLAFGGTRTYHRMACAIEDAGFEIRDMIEWLYFSGFPKSMDVSKQFDKMAGVEREVVGKRTDGRYAYEFSEKANRTGGIMGEGYISETRGLVTAPATDLAKQWDGWGTTLKPAHEPIVMARKPIEKTVAYNVEKYGTGAVNVDGCRIAFSDESDKRRATNSNLDSAGAQGGTYGYSTYEDRHKRSGSDEAGRFPANCITLDADEWYSKYFNVSPQEVSKKASKRDRGEGNTHPTVKPTDLMAWLVRLVTPPQGIVLDPFAGSGSTLVATKREGFNFIGIEMDEQYIEIARKRIANKPPQVVQ